MNIYDKITDFIFVEENEPTEADIIFVAGNSFPKSSEKAAEIYCKGFSPYIMPSGRYSITDGYFIGCSEKADIYNGDYKTEFEFMKDVLIKNGVPEKAILKEDMAQYTYQNALFSRENLDKMGMKINKAILCCKPVHTRRCLMYYQYVFPDVEFIVCPTKEAISRENWYTNSEGLEAVLSEVQRIGEQFKTVLL